MTVQTATRYPDVEQVVIEYLRTAFIGRVEVFLAGAVVGNFIPSPRPDRYVSVRRVGGVQVHPTVDLPLVDVQTWAPTWEEAHDLAAWCRAALYTMQLSTPVYRIRDFTGPTSVPDPLSDQPRYLFTVELAVRGVPFSL